MISIQAILQRNPDHIAVTAIDSHSDITEKNITYKELGSLINRVNFFFKKLELSSGDDLLIMLPNSLETVVVYLAAIEYGLNFIPLPCDASLNDINKILNLTDPKLWMISDLVVDKFAQINSDIKHYAVCIDMTFDWLDVTELAVTESRDSKLFIATSGTTGNPKIMVIDNNKLLQSGEAFLEFHNLSNSSLRFWNYLPMSYLGGLFNLLLIPLISGGSLVVTETFNGRTFFSFWNTIDRFDINALWFTPSIAKGLVKLGERTDFSKRKELASNVKHAFIGTAPISLKDKEEFESCFGINLLENFALSETTFFTSETMDTLGMRKESSVGCVLPYVKVKLEELADGQTEIMVKTPYLFDGYLTKKGKIELELDAEGFFGTNDLGDFDNEVLIIRGRNRDIIKKGGYFIQLREIEVFVENNSNISEACAVKIPHDFYGETYNLYVVTDLEKNEIQRWLVDNLIKYKWPENIILKKKLPKTSSGKVIKEKLLEEE